MSAVGRRYAKALIELGREAGDFEAVGRELKGVARAFDDPALARLVGLATLDRRTRRAMASQISARLGLSRLLVNFLGVLAVNNRLRELGTIDREYQRLEDRALGRVRARVRSARPLSDESQRRINEVFERRTGKQVIAEVGVDPELLGGVVVEVAGRVFDGSLRTRLERLERSLAG
ncbi:MAG: ATP synthase F1 subunit delta [Candidatus Binatia bacterium]